MRSFPCSWCLFRLADMWVRWRNRFSLARQAAVRPAGRPARQERLFLFVLETPPSLHLSHEVSSFSTESIEYRHEPSRRPPLHATAALLLRLFFSRPNPHSQQILLVNPPSTTAAHHPPLLRRLRSLLASSALPLAPLLPSLPALPPPHFPSPYPLLPLPPPSRLLLPHSRSCPSSRSSDVEPVR